MYLYKFMLDCKQTSVSVDVLLQIELCPGK